MHDLEDELVVLRLSLSGLVACCALLFGCPAALDGTLDPGENPPPRDAPTPQQDAPPPVAAPPVEPPSGDADAGGQEGPDAPDAGCGQDDPRVGQRATLRTLFHGVAGTARIENNCTIVIENFFYDGGGLDVRVYGSSDGTFDDGVILSRDLRRFGGYRGETLRIALPDDITLERVRHIAIWCIVADVNFGSGSFR